MAGIPHQQQEEVYKVVRKGFSVMKLNLSAGEILEQYRINEQQYRINHALTKNY